MTHILSQNNFLWPLVVLKSAFTPTSTSSHSFILVFLPKQIQTHFYSQISPGNEHQLVNKIAIYIKNGRSYFCLVDIFVQILGLFGYWVLSFWDSNVTEYFRCYSVIIKLP